MFALGSSSLDLVCVGASTVSFSCVFLRDVVTLWVNSVFLSLLIANEGLHWWLFLSDLANHFWGPVVVFLRPPSVCRRFWWLVAALLPGLSLSFASGLSSLGLICCLAMSLRYADWLSLWLCAHSLLGQGFHGLLACPSLSSLLWFCKSLWVLFSHMVHNLRDGVTPVGSRLVCPRSERWFSVFLFPFWAVSSCCHCPSGSCHHMGQVCWSVPAYARPTVVVGASHFLLLDGLRTSV